MPVDPNRVRDLFVAAVELPPDERPGYRITEPLHRPSERILNAHSGWKTAHNIRCDLGPGYS
jgi:hypothetical protein